MFWKQNETKHIFSKASIRTFTFGPSQRSNLAFALFGLRLKFREKRNRVNNNINTEELRQTKDELDPKKVETIFLCVLFIKAKQLLKNLEIGWLMDWGKKALIWLLSYKANKSFSLKATTTFEYTF